MASDSAVTVGGLKSFGNVQKIFNLDNNIPIGIMVNGPARFCGKSFKKLINEFKCEKFIGNFTVENVKNNFIKFLKSQNYSDDVDKLIELKLFEFKKFLSDQFEGITLDEFEYYIDNLETHEIFPFLINQNISFEEVLPDFVKFDSQINKKLLEIFSFKLLMESSEIIIAGFDEVHEYASYIQLKLIFKRGGKCFMK